MYPFFFFCEMLCMAQGRFCLGCNVDYNWLLNLFHVFMSCC